MRSNRQHLVEARQKSQEDYDKTLLALSSAALGLSLTFLKDILGLDTIIESRFVIGAWICWTLSTIAVLLSFYSSHRALTKTIEQIDNQARSLHTSPGGIFRQFTSYLNIASGSFFIFGIVSMGIFVYFNLVL